MSGTESNLENLSPAEKKFLSEIFFCRKNFDLVEKIFENNFEGGRQVERRFVFKKFCERFADVGNSAKYRL